MLPPEQQWQPGVFTPEIEQQLNSVLLGIFTYDRQGHGHLVGSAFIIGIMDDVALAVSARHVFEEVGRIRKPHERSHPSMPNIFRTTQAIVDMSPRHVAAMFFDGAAGAICEVLSIFALDELDIALFVVKKPAGASGAQLTTKCSVDTEPLRPGEEIAIAGLRQQIESEADHGSSIQYRVQRAVTLRYGRVSGSYITGGRSPWPAAETTIPVHGGMSGGPVFRMHADGYLKGVSAIVAKDLSPPEAFASTATAGHSTCAMLWPAMLMQVPFMLKRGNDEIQASSLRDLVKIGLIEDDYDFTAGFNVTLVGREYRVSPRILHHSWLPGAGAVT